MNKLSVLEEKFVEGIVVGKTSTRAAIDAGYAAGSAASAGSRLLRKVKVKTAIEIRRASAVAAAQAETNTTLARLLEELARTALCDPKDLFDAKGSMLALNEMPEDIRRAIASCNVEVTTEVVNSGAKGSKVAKVRATKIKFWDKLRAIDEIAKLAGYPKTDSTVGGELHPPVGR